MGPLATVGLGGVLAGHPPAPHGPGGAQILPAAFAGIGARLDAPGGPGLEIELRHGVALEHADGSTVELGSAGSARIAACWRFGG